MLAFPSVRRSSLAWVLSVALGAGAASAQERPPETPPPPATAAPSTAQPPAAPAAPPVTVSDVEVPGLNVRMGRSETVIHAPFEMVTRAMTDWPTYPEFMPHMREARVMRRNRNLTDLYVSVPLSSSLGVVWASLRLNVRRARDVVEIDGVALDGNVERFETRTVIERIPGPEPATRFTFHILAVPRLPFPSSVFTRENRHAASTVAHNVRARVETLYALRRVQPGAPAPAAGGATAAPPAEASRGAAVAPQ